jgi:hypothetical protein
MLDSYFNLDVPNVSIPSLSTTIGSLPLSASASLDVGSLGLSGSLSLGGSAPTLDPLSLIPTKADIVSSLNSAVTLPSMLSIAGLTDEAAAVANALNTAGIAIDASGFPFQLSSPILPTLRIPEIEWERRITALFEDMQALALAQITSEISSLIPDLPLDISILGVDLNILDLASDPAGFVSNLAGQLTSQVTDAVNNAVNLVDAQVSIVTQFLSSPYQAWANACGVISPDLIGENLISFAVSEVKGKMLDAIDIGINGLFNKFPGDAGALSFSLPAVPDIASLATGLVESAVADVKNMALSAVSGAIQNALAPVRALQASIVSAIESVSIFGFSALDIIGGRVGERIRSLERQYHRLVEGLYHFRHNWRRYMTTKFILEKGRSFFSEIGLDSLINIADFNITNFFAQANLSASIDLPVVGNLSASFSPSFSMNGIPSFSL